MSRPQPRRRARARRGPLLEFGSFLVDRRIALGLTQLDVAELADVGLSSVRALEGGHDSPTLAVTLRVLDALGLTLVSLTGTAADAITGRAARVRPAQEVDDEQLA
ncbi:helix-turn-helix transcriptional regulator [Nocardia farcinica]|uniref:Transcriptional regulator, y4mF family n=2 Tax=Nocardia farcinica TaxID=37329 RepID=A0A0H5P313_NOCFR|nr:helix-turn-helix transcriptional regulator [Nocardia farcinica]SLH37630.1 transcriptional regulator, y4mF family [Mycobacteroides abscessus subsp. abscessus]MBA4858222.1 helix-turn-helix transcriptional regulator [Nocardia farcinica]MBC9817009.1 helix-turn-helix transcriptional regulator [Nocardia farcinica]MBF6068835.1 helix-turn-helix transcriptional regulator [Nocardia farcinica]MBF6232173.1 helix-turn-helix transcriptional regulator [Nocardia farcinica]